MRIARISCAYVIAILSLWVSAGTASAACPVFEIVNGTASADTLSGRTQKATLFFGKGGNDTFRVEEPKLFSSTGCTSRDYWDKIGDYKDRELISVPGTVDSYFVSGCSVYWHRAGTPSNVRYFVQLNRCGIPKSSVRIS